MIERTRNGAQARRALVPWLIGAVALALVAGCGGEDRASAEATAAARLGEGFGALQGGVERGMPATIVMTDGQRFDPAQVTVPAGSTVIWRNSSSVQHTVTADPAQAASADNVRLPTGAQPFASEALSPDQTFSQQLTVPGEYRYVCRIHEGSGMVGTITVE